MLMMTISFLLYLILFILFTMQCSRVQCYIQMSLILERETTIMVKTKFEIPENAQFQKLKSASYIAPQMQMLKSHRNIHVSCHLFHSRILILPVRIRLMVLEKKVLVWSFIFNCLQICTSLLTYNLRNYRIFDWYQPCVITYTLRNILGSDQASITNGQATNV